MVWLCVWLRYGKSLPQNARDEPKTILSIRSHPSSAFIALISYEDSSLSYIIAAQVRLLFCTKFHEFCLCVGALVCACALLEIFRFMHVFDGCSTEVWCLLVCFLKYHLRLSDFHFCTLFMQGMKAFDKVESSKTNELPLKPGMCSVCVLRKYI